MRGLLVAAVAVIAVTAPALAATLAPNEIQSTFFTGQAFTSSTPSNIKFKMVFTADGKMTPIGLAAEIASPSFLAIHPNGKFVYAVSEMDSYNGQKAGSVSALSSSR